ncbi:GIY-YIG nuclease family protein [Streptomyces sp. NPDC127072]|uniref:GIY-YIG nuclease family protein n=1 Tax=Streptomyces sp. NPDC127072 TaxID=3347129 RepID=UPI00364E95AB
MTDPTSPCVGVEEGIACVATATITEPAPLCPRHQMQVAAAIVPALLASALEKPRVAERPEVRDAATVRVVLTAQATDLDLSGGHDDRVYFIRNGDRVKIGYTANLRNRLSSFGLRVDAVTLLLTGGKRLERALHRYFAQYRIPDTEWFHYVPEIDSYITSRLERLAQVQSVTSAVASDTVRITASRDALLAALHAHIGDRQAALLSDVLRALRSKGAPPHWTVKTLRRACEAHEIPIRMKVRVGDRVSIGVHRDDIPAAQMKEGP